MSDMITSLSAAVSGQKMSALHAQASTMLLKKAMNADEQIAAQMLQMMAAATPPSSGMDIRA